MNTQSIKSRSVPMNSLRKALRGNGVFSGLSGVVLLAGAAPIAEFTGIPASMPIGIVGGILVSYTGLLFWAAGQKIVHHRFGIIATLLDISWVVGSLAILLFGWPPMTTAGRWVVALLAEAVASIAVWQLVAMGFLRRRSG